jgi:hypothetical protein
MFLPFIVGNGMPVESYYPPQYTLSVDFLKQLSTIFIYNSAQQVLSPK